MRTTAPSFLTNVARTVGKKLGAVVLILDALKGAAPVIIAMLYSAWIGVTLLLSAILAGGLF